MKREKYSQMNDATAFGFLLNAMEGGQDKGAMSPRSDAEDLSRGLHFIPGEVTVARRKGQIVTFEEPCGHPCCWYWQFPDGSRIHYFERWDYEQIGKHNNRPVNPENGGFIGGAGPCPDCGNPHTRGGLISARSEEE